MKHSAGILMWRKTSEIEIFLVHPGGPAHVNRDEGAWSIPKGEFENEDASEAARREFKEETSFDLKGKLLPLKPVRQSSRKIVHAFVVEGDIDASAIKSNTVDIPWEGKTITIPEVDRAEWFNLETARKKLLKGQVQLIDQLNLLREES